VGRLSPSPGLSPLENAQPGAILSRQMFLSDPTTGPRSRYREGGRRQKITSQRIARMEGSGPEESSCGFRTCDARRWRTRGGGTLQPTDTDEVLEAIDSVVQALKENVSRTEVALQRAAEIREQRLAGRSYTEIYEHSERPLLVEILTTNVLELHEVGHQLRTRQASALRQEGLSTQRIAQLYGVSRQRIMALLRSASSSASQGISQLRT
jgi:hypothetical protein